MNNRRRASHAAEPARTDPELRRVAARTRSGIARIRFFGIAHIRIHDRADMPQRRRAGADGPDMRSAAARPFCLLPQHGNLAAYRIVLRLLGGEIKCFRLHCERSGNGGGQIGECAKFASISVKPAFGATVTQRDLAVYSLQYAGAAGKSSEVRRTRFVQSIDFVA
ncbi:hypothetical protein [Burkholderia thailandensis]|uniref:hypothetical protein n=1 Tax=Burkholderia thailandensis TaxID=57975 RepID=UPI002D78ED34|nr:hypothetical protein [Burkholderia thailandensis]WRS69262.1 hypothetical protein U9S59_21205 [Burkholderia thailandensis]